MIKKKKRTGFGNQQQNKQTKHLTGKNLERSSRMQSTQSPEGNSEGKRNVFCKYQPEIQKQ